MEVRLLQIQKEKIKMEIMILEENLKEEPKRIKIKQRQKKLKKPG